MRLNHLGRQLTAALLSGAMLLGLCAPALAAAPGTAPDSVPAAADALNEENADDDIFFFIGETQYTVTDSADAYPNGVTYDPTSKKLTFDADEHGTFPSLKIDAPGVNVVITGSSDAALVNTAVIRCDTLSITNNGDGRAVGDDLTYYNTSAQEVVLRADGIFWDAVASGSATTFPDYYVGSIASARKITAASEAAYPLVLENCAVSDWSGNGRDRFYAGEQLYIYPTRPKNGLSFNKWKLPDDLEHYYGSAQNNLYITMPDKETAITAIWNIYGEQEGEESQVLEIGWTNSTPKLLTPEDLKDQAPIEVSGRDDQLLTVTYGENSSYIVTLNHSDGSFYSGLRITGYSGKAGETPSVVFNSSGYQLARLNVEGVENFTAESDSGEAIGSVCGVNIDCSGNVKITCNSPNLAAVRTDSDSFTIKNAGDVTINGSYALLCPASVVSINCSGSVELTSTASEADAVSAKSFAINGANDVTISGRNAVRSRSNADILCSGNVKLTGNTKAAVDANSLTIDGANNVTLTGAAAVFNGSYEAVSGGSPDAFTAITCRGEVELKTTAGEKLVDVNEYSGSVDNLTLTYKQANNAPYTVYTTPDSVDTGDTDVPDTALLTAELPDVPVDKPNTGANVIQKEAGESFSIGSDDDYTYIRIVPELPPVSDSDADGAGSISTAGGAVAAVLVGGAAVVGGYEVATRIILSQLLPEGAAIPKNQGELALLVWSNANKPEPAAVAPYADDTAKAIQWCVEQGYLDNTDTSKWTPKLRVIQVWSRAFPKR